MYKIKTRDPKNNTIILHLCICPFSKCVVVKQDFGQAACTDSLFGRLKCLPSQWQWVSPKSPKNFGNFTFEDSKFKGLKGKFYLTVFSSKPRIQILPVQNALFKFRSSSGVIVVCVYTRVAVFMYVFKEKNECYLMFILCDLWRKKGTKEVGF